MSGIIFLIILCVYFMHIGIAIKIAEHMRNYPALEDAREWSIYSIMGAFGIVILFAPSNSPNSFLWHMDMGDILLIAFSMPYALMYLGWGMMQWHLYKTNKLWSALLKRSIFLSISAGLFLTFGLYMAALIQNAPRYSPPKTICTCIVHKK